MIKATIIFGTDAVRHYDETDEVPVPETLDEIDGTVIRKEFSTKEVRDAYMKALEDYDGYNEYRIVDFEETPDKTLDIRVKEVLGEGALVSLYLWMGIEVLQERISDMDDEAVWKMFGGVMKPGKIRGNIRVIHNRLNNLPDDYQPE